MSGANSSAEPVLAVDLDGTLISGDLALLSALAYVRGNPLRILRVLFWLAAGGRLRAKLEIAKLILPDCASLPWRTDVCEFVRGEQRRGRKVVLASAAAFVHAAAAAQQFGGFAAVHGSEPGRNLYGSAKADLLDEMYGVHNWDYIGDSPRQDPPVMRRARVAHLARQSRRLRVSAKKIGKEFVDATNGTATIFKTLLRPRQRTTPRRKL